jgi:hypothetical protein
MIRVFAYCFTALLFGAIVFSIFVNSSDWLNALIALLALVIVGGTTIGNFWMMYMAVRYEKEPFPLVAMACLIPFSCVWYYLGRVRPGKHFTRENVPTN